MVMTTVIFYFDQFKRCVQLNKMFFYNTSLAFSMFRDIPTRDASTAAAQ